MVLREDRGDFGKIRTATLKVTTYSWPKPSWLHFSALVLLNASVVATSSWTPWQVPKSGEKTLGFLKETGPMIFSERPKRSILIPWEPSEGFPYWDSLGRFFLDQLRLQLQLKVSPLSLYQWLMPLCLWPAQQLGVQDCWDDYRLYMIVLLNILRTQFWSNQDVLNTAQIDFGQQLSSTDLEWIGLQGGNDFRVQECRPTLAGSSGYLDIFAIHGEIWQVPRYLLLIWHPYLIWSCSFFETSHLKTPCERYGMWSSTNMNSCEHGTWPLLRFRWAVAYPSAPLIPWRLVPQLAGFLWTGHGRHQKNVTFHDPHITDIHVCVFEGFKTAKHQIWSLDSFSWAQRPPCGNNGSLKLVAETGCTLQDRDKICSFSFM